MKKLSMILMVIGAVCLAQAAPKREKKTITLLPQDELIKKKSYKIFDTDDLKKYEIYAYGNASLPPLWRNNGTQNVDNYAFQQFAVSDVYYQRKQFCSEQSCYQRDFFCIGGLSTVSLGAAITWLLVNKYRGIDTKYSLNAVEAIGSLIVGLGCFFRDAICERWKDWSKNTKSLERNAIALRHALDGAELQDEGGNKIINF